MSLYGRLIAARVRAQLQYRTSFAIETVGVFLVSFLDFVAILIMFSNVPQLGAWSVSEVALLYALATLSFAFTDLLIGHLDTVFEKDSPVQRWERRGERVRGPGVRPFGRRS